MIHYTSLGILGLLICLSCPRRPEVPSTEHEFQQAWTQPVGWHPPVGRSAH